MAQMMTQRRNKLQLYILIFYTKTRLNNKNLILRHEHHNGADQTTHMNRLVSTFVVGFLESILEYLYIGETGASMAPF